MIPFRGLVLSQQVYGSPDLRRLGDLDIAVGDERLTMRCSFDHKPDRVKKESGDSLDLYLNLTTAEGNTSYLVDRILIVNPEDVEQDLR